MKKILHSICFAALLATSLTPVQVFAKESSSTYTNEQGVKLLNLEVDSNGLSVISKNLKNVKKYVFVGEDGYFHLNPKVKELLSNDEYEFFEKNNEKLNTLIKEGVIQLDKKGQIVNKFESSLLNKKDSNEVNRLDAYEDMQEYWWGVHYVLNRTQADELQASLEDAKDTYDFYTIALILVPEVMYSKALSIIAGIIGKYCDMMASDIEDEKTRYGVYVDFDWSGVIYSVYSR